MRIVKLDENTRSQALARLIGRGASGYGEYEKTVQDIIADVRESGDGAVIAYEKKFDRCDLTSETLRVSQQEIMEAYKALDPAFIEVMKKLRIISVSITKSRRGPAGSPRERTA